MPPSSTWCASTQGLQITEFGRVVTMITPIPTVFRCSYVPRHARPGHKAAADLHRYFGARASCHCVKGGWGWGWGAQFMQAGRPKVTFQLECIECAVLYKRRQWRGMSSSSHVHGDLPVQCSIEQRQGDLLWGALHLQLRCYYSNTTSLVSLM